MKNSKKLQSLKTRITPRKLVAILCVVLIMAAVLYLLRGWIRETVLPVAVKTIYGNSTERVYQEEVSKLQQPLSLLGFLSAELETGKCYRVVANGFSTQVDCSHDIRAYRQIDTSPEAKKNLVANAEKLQVLLKENGWKGEYSNDSQYSSLTKLVSSITEGIDYQPGTGYEKEVDGVLCYLTSSTAFMSPDPPSMSSQISCSRTFNILGEPSWN